MQHPDKFLSCDWGTTAFRLKLVAASDFRIIAEESSRQGIAATYDAWKKAGQGEEARFAFYAAAIEESMQRLATAGDLAGIPLIISGMASSTIGMAELPYKPLPFALDGSDLTTHIIEATAAFPHTTLLISGAKSDDDVMRGEETQVVGCMIEAADGDLMIIHPGTHPKHITVAHGKVTDFRTYMTGEVFSLLSAKSILAASVEAGGALEEPGNRAAFETGVREGAAQHLLHSAFLVRTADLFKKRSKAENYFYLSGLLIGSELTDFRRDYRGNIILAGASALIAQYGIAMEVLGIAGRAASVTLKDADDITLAGQYKVYQQQHRAS